MNLKSRYFTLLDLIHSAYQSARIVHYRAHLSEFWANMFSTVHSADYVQKCRFRVQTCRFCTVWCTKSEDFVNFCVKTSVYLPYIIYFKASNQVTRLPIFYWTNLLGQCAYQSRDHTYLVTWSIFWHLPKYNKRWYWKLSSRF